MSFNGGTDLPVVLYVEDDDLCRELMGVFLVHFMGLSREEHIHLFDSSTDFLTRLQALPAKPDVILLDIHMWPVDGFELLAQLRQQPEYENIPVVALTASVMAEEVKKMRQAGFSGCIAKPLDQETFVDSLTQVLVGAKIW